MCWRSPHTLPYWTCGAAQNWSMACCVYKRRFFHISYRTSVHQRCFSSVCACRSPRNPRKQENVHRSHCSADGWNTTRRCSSDLEEEECTRHNATVAYKPRSRSAAMAESHTRNEHLPRTGLRQLQCVFLVNTMHTMLYIVVRVPLYSGMARILEFDSRVRMLDAYVAYAHAVRRTARPA